MSGLKLTYTVLKSFFVCLFGGEGSANKSTDDDGTSEDKRPDYKCKMKIDEDIEIITAYGEIKCEGEPDELIKRDIYRLGIFSKNAMDTYHLNNIVSFMATGPQIRTFISFRGLLYYFLKMNQFVLPICRSVTGLPESSRHAASRPESSRSAASHSSTKV